MHIEIQENVTYETCWESPSPHTKMLLCTPFHGDTEPLVFSLSVCLSYHIDELYESQSEGDLHLLRHVLHRPDQLVVAAEQVADEALLLLRTQT